MKSKNEKRTRSAKEREIEKEAIKKIEKIASRVLFFK